MLGGVFVELQQGVEVVGDLGDRLGVLGAVVELEGLGRDLGLVNVVGVVDVLERGVSARGGLRGSSEVPPWDLGPGPVR